MTSFRKLLFSGLLILFVMSVSAYSVTLPLTEDKDVIVGGKQYVFPGDNNSPFSEVQTGYNIRDQGAFINARSISTQYKPDPTAASVLNSKSDNLAVFRTATRNTGKTKLDNASPGGALAYELSDFSSKTL